MVTLLISLVNCLNTLLSLVSGFTETTDSNKENVVVTLNSSGAGAGVTPKKSSSVPLGMDGAGQPGHQHQGSSSKKRKLFTQSLGIIT